MVQLPITLILRAIGIASDSQILELFGEDERIVATLAKDPIKTEEEALIEIYKRLRPGEMPSVEAAKSLLAAMFFDPRRYDLTKVFKYRRNSLGAKLIYHSYAPKLESYAKSLTVLPKLDGVNPKVELVNLKNELIMGNKSPISKTLHNEINKVTSKKGKVLLILNNKGYSQFVICRSCGEVINCDDCGTAMQYQMEKNIQ